MKNEPVIDITQDDLPLHCPTAHHGVWDSHPRVFLAIEEKGEVRCPYCGTLYRLKGWEQSSLHTH